MEKKPSRKAKSNNRNKIIEAAIRLIGEKGVEGTSLADIARDVGISKGTLYYYYSIKNDLIFDITQDHMDKITENIFSLIEENKGKISWQDMIKLLIEMLLKSETRTRLHLYLIQEVLSGNEDLKKRFVETYTHWFQMIQDGYEILSTRKKDLTVHARILVSVIDGLIIQASMGISDVPLELIIQELARLIDG